MESLKNLTDEELVGLLNRGDEAAYSEIYDRYWNVLYAMAYNRLRERQRAEDVVQDVLLGLWGNRDQPIGKLKHYLAVAVKYQVIAQVQRQSRQRDYEAAEGQGSGMPDAPGADERLHHKQLLRFLQHEIDSLPDKCRLVFRYSREENLTAPEIAERLGISTSTVENQLNKALGRLRKTMDRLQSLIFWL